MILPAPCPGEVGGVCDQETHQRLRGGQADQENQIICHGQVVVIFIFKSSGVVESKLVGVHIDILYCFFVARIFFVDRSLIK